MKYTKEDNRSMSAAPHCTAHNTQYTNTHHTIHDTPLEQIIRNMWHTRRDMWYVLHNMWYVICDTWYTVHNKAKVLGGSFCVLEDVWGGYSSCQHRVYKLHDTQYVSPRDMEMYKTISSISNPILYLKGTVLGTGVLVAPFVSCRMCAINGHGGDDGAHYTQTSMNVKTKYNKLNTTNKIQQIQ